MMGSTFKIEATIGDALREEEDEEAVSIMPCLRELIVFECQNLKALPHRLLRRTPLDMLDITYSHLLIEQFKSRGGYEFLSPRCHLGALDFCSRPVCTAPPPPPQDATGEPDTAELKFPLQKLLKLVKSDCFKAKSALLVLIGSIVSVGAAKTKNLLNCLISTTVEFLSSEDWATRKAAAEVLERLVATERDMLPEFKASCVATLESRRFDKIKNFIFVKVVRDNEPDIRGVERSSCSIPRGIDT
ncbi:Uncharacterized protein Fot_53843 [Forsythia ovata]|uniref:TORTIFOLIA1/SINE1-2 N-terminal domain-containing protein n=1 Tax=Forsythia ovata TaxID=205694 RepID=A0ABD1PFC2_9LAMI